MKISTKASLATFIPCTTFCLLLLSGIIFLSGVHLVHGSNLTQRRVKDESNVSQNLHYDSNEANYESSSLSSGCFDLDIEILPDRWAAEETRWELHDQFGNIIAQGGNSEFSEYILYEREIACLTETCGNGFYTFKIIDSYGDGLVWNTTDPGYFKIFVNGIQFFGDSDGVDFGYLDTVLVEYCHPSSVPSSSPSISSSPTTVPSSAPTAAPSTSPSVLPSSLPSLSPSASPTTVPSSSPSTSPSKVPSLSPSASPSSSPTTFPSSAPTAAPSSSPSSVPSSVPSMLPSSSPSLLPSTAPTLSLADKFEWYITPLTNGTMYGQSTFTMEYNVSNRDYEFDVFQEDCTTKVEYALEEIESVNSLSDGFLNVTASLSISQEDIENEAGIWSSSINGGEIRFCVVMSLFLKHDNEDVLMNFHETVYRINVDKTSDFELVDIVAERTGAQDGGSEFIDYEENITAFQCNDDYTMISPVRPLSQGDILQVCVLVEDNNSIFEVDYVQDMNITQPDNDDSPVMVVSHRTSFAYDALTFTECNGGNNQMCRVKFQLLASFFGKSEPPDLTVSGIIKLKLKTTARRLYQSMDSGLFHYIHNTGSKRKLEGNEGTDFALDVELSNELHSASFQNRRLQNGYAILAITGVAYGFW